VEAMEAFSQVHFLLSLLLIFLLLYNFNIEIENNLPFLP
jgi:hypothetical protein